MLCSFTHVHIHVHTPWLARTERVGRGSGGNAGGETCAATVVEGAARYNEGLFDCRAVAACSIAGLPVNTGKCEG